MTTRAPHADTTGDHRASLAPRPRRTRSVRSAIAVRSDISKLDVVPGALRFPRIVRDHLAQEESLDLAHLPAPEEEPAARTASPLRTPSRWAYGTNARSISRCAAKKSGVDSSCVSSSSVPLMLSRAALSRAAAARRSAPSRAICSSVLMRSSSSRTTSGDARCAPPRRPRSVRRLPRAPRPREVRRARLSRGRTRAPSRCASPACARGVVLNGLGGRSP